MFTGVLSLSPPPRPVFPVYKFTNSLPTYRRALLSERLEQAKMQMTTLRLVSHYIFTFRKKSHASGTRAARERGVIDTRKEPREQGVGKVFSRADVIFSFPQLLATLPRSSLLYFSDTFLWYILKQ